MIIRRTSSAVALLLIMGLLATFGIVVGAPRAEAALVTSLAVDNSNRLPATTRNEAFGDMLDLGYDQRAVLEGNDLNIYAPPHKGGGLLKSTPSDLSAAPASDRWDTWQVLTKMKDVAEGLELRQGYLAFVDNGGGGRNELIIAGSTGGGLEYRNWWYRVPSDGSCATSGCARVKEELPNEFGVDSWDSYRKVAVTSLAVDDSGTNLAVGLSDHGAWIYNVSTGEKRSEFDGCAINGETFAPQTPVVALAFGPADPQSRVRTLAVACLTKGDIGYMAKVTAAGDITSWRLYKNSPGTDLLPTAIAAAVGHLANGKEVVAFGMSGGDVKIVDPTVTSGITLASAPPPSSGGMVGGLTFVDRIDGTSTSAQDLAVGQAKNFGSQVLRFDGSTTLKPLPLQATGDPDNPDAKTTTDLNGLRQWFPGYKLGRFSVRNNAHQPLTISLLSKPDGGYGCWFGPAVPGGKLFPGKGTVSLPWSPSQPTVGPYTMGGLTAGEGGLCGPTPEDETDQWAAYLVVTPTSHPADRKIVKLELDRSGGGLQLSQAGGSLRARAERTGNETALGSWMVTIDGFEGAKVDEVPRITSGTALPNPAIPGVPPRPTVYRFDTQYGSLTLPPRLQDQIPAVEIQGSVDRTNWTKLGDLVPRTAPVITPQTSDPDGPKALFLGRATFWWENRPGQPAYRYFRTKLGDVVTAPFNDFDITRAKKPAAVPGVNGVTVTPTNADGVARPVSNGLDQGPLKVVVQDANSNPIPATSPAYGQIYYRDTLNRLVTNLYRTGDDPNDFIGVSPYAGLYANNGSIRSGTSSTYNYVSTTSPHDQKIVGFVAGGLTGGNPTPSGNIEVSAAELSPQVSPDPDLDGGFSLEGCSDFSGSTTCRLAVPTDRRPIMYQVATEVPRIGILTDALAVTSTVSLPLQQTANQNEHQLADPELQLTERTVSLDDLTMFGPGDRIDTTLATHGTLVPVTAIPTGE